MEIKTIPATAHIDPAVPGQLLVYLVIHRRTRQCYVGIVSGRKQTVTGRWRNHCMAAMHGAPNKLEQAIRQHKPQAFLVVVVAWARNRKRLAQLERSYVRLFGTFPHGYNGSAGGNAPTWGELWQDPEYRSKKSTETKCRWQDPVYRQSMRSAQSAGTRNAWRNNQQFREACTAGSRRLWADPIFRAKMRKIATANGRSAQNRQRLAARNKRNWRDPEFRERMVETARQTQLRLAKDPVVRQRRSRASRRMWRGNDALRQRVREARRKQWQDPEFRKRHSAAVSAANRRRGISDATI